MKAREPTLLASPTVAHCIHGNGLVLVQMMVLNFSMWLLRVLIYHYDADNQEEQDRFCWKTLFHREGPCRLLGDTINVYRSNRGFLLPYSGHYQITSFAKKECVCKVEPSDSILQVHKRVIPLLSYL